MTDIKNPTNVVKEETKQVKKFISKREKFETASNAHKLPDHVRNLILLLKNNSEIRRFTSLNIIKYLKDAGQITSDKNYVDFKWSHFVLTSDGLRRDFRYNEPWLISCLAESFELFAASAERIITTYIKEEGIVVNAGQPG